MIARAIGAQVIAVDISDAALDRARDLGASRTVSARGLGPGELAEAVVRAAAAVEPVADRPGGVAVTVDALGRQDTITSAIASLGPLGRHVQIGPLDGEPVIDVPRVIALELSILGSHGMAAPATRARRPRRLRRSAAAGSRHHDDRSRTGTAGDARYG